MNGTSVLLPFLFEGDDSSTVKRHGGQQRAETAVEGHLSRHKRVFSFHEWPNKPNCCTSHLKFDIRKTLSVIFL